MQWHVQLFVATGEKPVTVLEGIQEKNSWFRPSFVQQESFVFIKINSFLQDQPLPYRREKMLWIIKASSN